VQPATQAATAPPSLGQSLVQPDKPSVWITADSPEPARLVDVLEPVQSPPKTPRDEQVPVNPSAPAERPFAPAPPALDSPKGDFYQAFPRDRGSLLARRGAPLQTRADDPEERSISRPTFGASAVIGTAAAAAGYRFVLRQSDDQDRRRWWSARFSTR
jgi:hypothetical protein